MMCPKCLKERLVETRFNDLVECLNCNSAFELIENKER